MNSQIVRCKLLSTIFYCVELFPLAVSVFTLPEVKLVKNPGQRKLTSTEGGLGGKLIEFIFRYIFLMSFSYV